MINMNEQGKRIHYPLEISVKECADRKKIRQENNGQQGKEIKDQEGRIFEEVLTRKETAQKGPHVKKVIAAITLTTLVALDYRSTPQEVREFIKEQISSYGELGKEYFNHMLKKKTLTKELIASFFPETPFALWLQAIRLRAIP